MSTKKRILIVDDHPAFRYGLTFLLESASDLDVCAQAGSVGEAASTVEANQFDLVISDLTLPDGNGLELVKNIKAMRPELPILVVSMHDELVYAERVLRAGARGYLMKEDSDFLLSAIRQIFDGGVYVSQPVTEHFLNSMAGNKGGPEPFSFPLTRLTDRELEIFEALGQAKGADQIATQFNISVRTVDAHRTHIRTKLGLTDSNELLRYAIRWVESGKVEPVGTAAVE